MRTTTLPALRPDRTDARHRRLGWLAVPALVATALVGLPATAQAATITVGDECSFASAIDSANGDLAAGECAAGYKEDTIVLPAGVFPGPIVIEDDLTIIGAGSSATTIDGMDEGTVVTIRPGVKVTIQGVTITGGLGATGSAGTNGQSSFSDGAPGGPGGHGGTGGIHNSGELLLIEVAVHENTGGPGGAGGIGGNAADGRGGTGGAGGSGGTGGIHNQGWLVTEGASVTSNTAGAGGSGGQAGQSGTETRPINGSDGGAGGRGGPGAVANLGRLTTDSTPWPGNAGGAGGVGGNGGMGSSGYCRGWEGPRCPAGGGRGGVGGAGGPGGLLVEDGTRTTSVAAVFEANSGSAGGLGGAGGAGIAADSGQPSSFFDGPAGAAGAAGADGIAKGGQSLSWTTAPPASAHTDTTFDVVALSTARLPALVTTSGQCTAPAAGTTGVATAATVGSCTVTTNAAADDFYHAAAPFSAIVTVTDPTPPVVSVLVTGTLGNNGWYRSDVSVTWTVTEPQSPGSLATVGCVNQTLSADQSSSDYSCEAHSEGGDAEPQSVSVKIDKTAPTVTGTVSPNPVLQGLLATASGAVTDAGSGPVSATATCAPVGTGSVGSASVTCTGRDLAGNTTTITVPYEVISASAAIDLLAGQVTSTVPRQLRTPLLAQLQSAQTQRDRGNDAAAVDSLEDFTALVSAQRGKKITAAGADALRALARQVIASIENSPSGGA